MQITNEFGINRLTLQFPRELEREFLRDSIPSTTSQVRAGLLGSAALTVIALGTLAMLDPGGDGYWRPRFFGSLQCKFKHYFHSSRKFYCV